MDFESFFREELSQLRKEGRYRVFADLERCAGRFPRAIYHGDGTPREVFTKVDRVRALGLDVPPMTDLAHSLRADGVDVRADVLTVDEMVEEVCRLSSNI